MTISWIGVQKERGDGPSPPPSPLGHLLRILQNFIFNNIRPPHLSLGPPPFEFLFYLYHIKGDPEQLHIISYLKFLTQVSNF